MTIGSAANAAYAHEWLDSVHGDERFGPLARLLVIVLAEKACTGAAVVTIDQIVGFCGGDCFGDIELQLFFLRENGVIDWQWTGEGTLAAWLPIAESMEIEIAVSASLGQDWRCIAP